MDERNLEAILAGFAGARIIVVGDLMLDEYVWGEVRRISQEAPIPVVEVQQRTYAPGGAANVATNVASLGGKALLGGVVGKDEPGAQLQRMLRESGVVVDGLLPDAERPTTTKTRIIAHSQQVVRVDSEQRTPLTEEFEAQLLRWAESLLPTVGACVISDYNKGTISPAFAQKLIGLAGRQRKPVVVDPKGTDYARYRGATVIKPNVHEAERAANIEIHDADDLRKVSDYLLRVLGDSALLITRGAEGMSLIAREVEALHIPAVARNVYDSTGAGDTVVSTLALALAAGATLAQAALLANRAAGIVVGKLGTARVALEELQRDKEA